MKAITTVLRDRSPTTIERHVAGLRIFLTFWASPQKSSSQTMGSLQTLIEARQSVTPKNNQVGTLTQMLQALSFVNKVFRPVERPFRSSTRASGPPNGSLLKTCWLSPKSRPCEEHGKPRKQAKVLSVSEVKRMEEQGAPNPSGWVLYILGMCLCQLYGGLRFDDIRWGPLKDWVFIFSQGLH